MRRLLGEPVTVRATARSIRPDLPPLDSLSALITWDSGVTSSYQVSYAVDGPETPLTIVGTEGALVMDRQWVELRRAGQVVERWDEPSPVQGMVEMYRDFARAVRGGGPPLSTPAEATADLQLIVAMLRSAEEGGRVEVGKV